MSRLGKRCEFLGGEWKQVDTRVDAGVLSVTAQSLNVRGHQLPSRKDFTHLIKASETRRHTCLYSQPRLTTGALGFLLIELDLFPKL